MYRYLPLKMTYLVSLFIFELGSLICGVAPSANALIVGRALAGLGGAGLATGVLTIIAFSAPPEMRPMLIGINGSMYGIASVCGPLLGGVFTHKVTWRWCFYINLPISGVAIFVLFFVLKLHNPKTGVREGLAALDWMGSLAIVGGTIMFLLGLEFGGVTFPWSSAEVICLIVFGLVLVGIFIVVEWKVAKFPLIPMRLFTVRSNIASIAVSACHGFVFISASYYLPLYFQGVLGAPPLLSGVYVLPFSLSLSVASTVTGIFIKKTGKYLPCIIFGCVVTTLGFGLFIDLEAKANWAKIILFQLVAGLGVGPNFQSPLISLQTTVQPRDIASATATFGFIRQLAMSISVVIGGVIFQNGMQKQYPTLLKDLGPDIANLLTGSSAGASVGVVSQLPGEEGDRARAAYFTSLRTMYIVYTAFAGLGLVLSFFVGQRQLSKEHHEHKTGLKGMMEARDEKKEVVPEREASPGGVRDEEKALQGDNSNSEK